LVEVSPPDGIGKPPERAPSDLRRYIRRKTQLEPRSTLSGSMNHPVSPVSVPTYDLSPWAEQVTERIQNLWRLDAAQSGQPRGKVEVEIVVGRDGSLKSIDILRSSDDEGLDRAAVRSVEANLPFPPLPEDFPLDRLEFRLVFEYDY
jgi:TonB family protein